MTFYTIYILIEKNRPVSGPGRAQFSKHRLLQASNRNQTQVLWIDNLNQILWVDDLNQIQMFWIDNLKNKINLRISIDLLSTLLFHQKLTLKL